MVSKLMAGALGLASLAVVGVSSANEPAKPIQLSAAQMDNVTAGGMTDGLSHNKFVLQYQNQWIFMPGGIHIVHSDFSGNILVGVQTQIVK
jgi:hypothetical protein